MKGSKLRRRMTRSPVLTGAILLVLVLVALLAVYQKERIGTALSSGDTVKADFSRDFRLVPNRSDVKIAGVVVGAVTDVDNGTPGRSTVSMKVWDDTTSKLGSAPSAIIRPTTLLGGNYFVELTPGGTGAYDGSTIPVTRTSTPVELDSILAAIPQSARDSIQKSTALADQTLSAGAGAPLGKVLQDAPGTLTPAGTVLTALRGTQPDQDLWSLVPDLNSAAIAVTGQDGQLGRVVDSLATVSATLAAQRRPLANTLASLPQTLSDTRSGLDSLNGTLSRLTATAPKVRPVAQQLSPLLTKAEPVLQQAQPLVANLRPLLHETLPLVDELVPTAQQTTTTLDYVKGPVLDAVNGPIAKTVLSPWKGTGAYEGDGGSGHLLYQEVGYLAAHSANLSGYGDQNGRMLGLSLGAGVSSVGGNDPGTAQFLQALGLLPGGAVQVLPPPNNSGDTFTPEPATAPGKGVVLPGILGTILGPLGK